jgi:hypothetical protein
VSTKAEQAGMKVGKRLVWPRILRMWYAWPANKTMKEFCDHYGLKYNYLKQCPKITEEGRKVAQSAGNHPAVKTRIDQLSVRPKDKKLIRHMLMDSMQVASNLLRIADAKLTTVMPDGSLQLAYDIDADELKACTQALREGVLVQRELKEMLLMADDAIPVRDVQAKFEVKEPEDDDED